MLTGWISSSICCCHCQASLMKSSSQNTASVRGCRAHSLFAVTLLPPYSRLVGIALSLPGIHEVITLYWSVFDLHLKDVFTHLGFIDNLVTTYGRLYLGWVVCDDQILITNMLVCTSQFLWVMSMFSIRSLNSDVKPFIHLVPQLQCQRPAADITTSGLWAISLFLPETIKQDPAEGSQAGQLSNHLKLTFLCPFLNWWYLL